MTLGESAGRTRGNTVRPAARRRMSEAERAQHTHLKDDPQSWPDERNTVHKISGRILGAMLMTIVCTFGVYLIQQYRFPLSFVGVMMVSAFGYYMPRIISWETTRRL